MSKSTPYLFFFCVIVNFLSKIQTVTVQHSLTPGDVGSNLYIFDAMIRGDIPYRDFSWMYGPLMLYFNALVFKIFGHEIHNVMWARLIFESVFSGVYFLAARTIMPSLAAVLAALAFGVFAHDFEHNFCLYGGICMEIGLLWAVLSYCKRAEKKYITWGFFIVLILGFIKINFGGFLLCGMCLGFLLCDLFRHEKFFFQSLFKYAGVFLATILIWMAIYYLFVKDMPIHEIKQCFPFFKGYLYNGGSVPDGFVNIYKTSWAHVHQNRLDAIIAGLSLLGALRIIFHMIWNHSCVVRSGRNAPLIILILLVFTVLSYHEFIPGRIDYQAYWVTPFTVMINAYLISEGCMISGRFVQILIVLLISSMIIIQGRENWHFFAQFKNDAHYFRHKGMNVYVTTDPRDLQTMLETSAYIEKNISPNVNFFAFPSDAIYYYLSGHRDPDWFLWFFKQHTIPPEQEMKLIFNLEKKHVEYIEMSNVCYYGSAYGVLGQNFGLLFNKYLHKYFEEVALFNNSKYAFWEGTRIFKRKSDQILQIKSPADLN